MASKADDDHEEAQDACIGGEWRLNAVSRKHREILSKLGLLCFDLVIMFSISEGSWLI